MEYTDKENIAKNNNIIIINNIIIKVIISWATKTNLKNWQDYPDTHQVTNIFQMEFNSLWL